jgi:hypothetical protein
MTLVFGWWSITGLFLTPISIVNNISYLSGHGAVPTPTERQAFETAVAHGEPAAVPHRKTSPLVWAFFLFLIVMAIVAKFLR